MSLPLELLDKYQTTVLDFWRLRPRQFLAGLKNHPSKYMTPGLFAGLSVVIVLALDIVANQLMVPVAQELGYSNMPPAESLAAFDLALFRWEVWIILGHAQRSLIPTGVLGARRIMRIA